jgi:uncharacterized protein YcsI (UPF0317 family)
MVNNCANSGCGKPLHYLREGRIYIFDASAGAGEPGGRRTRHLAHYWLCGVCSQNMMMVQSSHGTISVVPKPPIVMETEEIAPVVASMLAY